MTKYIIKNCPALLISGICNGINVKGLACKNNTDCLLKRIVELCKEPNEPYYNPECEFGIGRTDLAEEILELLEIEECEE